LGNELSTFKKISPNSFQAVWAENGKGTAILPIRPVGVESPKGQVAVGGLSARSPSPEKNIRQSATPVKSKITLIFNEAIFNLLTGYNACYISIIGFWSGGSLSTT
jgi:hypothetical protein